MRQGSAGTSGVSTETIRLLRWLAWPMCSMSMFSPLLSPLACGGAAKRRGAAAKPAPKPKVFLRKSRLFFMALPLQELADPTVPRNSMDIGSKRDARPGSRHQVAALAIPLSRRRGGNSDAKNAERGWVSAGRRGRAAIQNPCGRGIGHQKLDRSIQDYGGGLDYRHLRNNLSQNGETFRRDAIRLARLLHQQRTYGLNTWAIHSRVIVSHSGHGVRRLSAMP